MQQCQLPTMIEGGTRLERPHAMVHTWAIEIQRLMRTCLIVCAWILQVLSTCLSETIHSQSKILTKRSCTAGQRMWGMHKDVLLPSGESITENGRMQALGPQQGGLADYSEAAVFPDEQFAMHLPLTVAVRINSVALRQKNLTHLPDDPLLFGLETVSLYSQLDVSLESREDNTRHGGFSIYEFDVYATQSSGFPADSSLEAKTLSVSIGEPVTGEVSGVMLKLDLSVVEKVSTLALSENYGPKKPRARSSKEYNPRMHDRPSRSRLLDNAESRDIGSEELNEGLPFPVLLHFQNIEMSLAAPFSWPMGDFEESKTTHADKEASVHEVPLGDGDKTFLGKITFMLVRGKVEGQAGPASALTVDLDSDTGDGMCVAQPVLMLHYEEWERETMVSYAKFAEEQGSESNASISMDTHGDHVVRKVVDQKVFSIQRAFVHGSTPHNVEVHDDEEGKDKAGDKAGEDAQASAFGRSDLDYHSSDEEDVTPARGSAWQQSRRSGIRRRGRARSLRREAGSVRVVMNGMRLDWQAPVQHSMLEVCLAHYTHARQARVLGMADEASNRRSDEVDAPGLVRLDSCAGRCDESPTLPQVSFEVHDTWLDFSVTKRAVFAVDVPHAILSLSQEPQDHLPCQLLDGSLGEEIFCALDMRDFALHRMRDSAEAPDILAGSIGKSSFQADCDTYPQRPPTRVPSDRFLSIEIFRAGAPLAVMQRMQRMANPADADRVDDETGAHRAHIEIVGFLVSIPMPANISLHGRREGLRGKWSKQDRFVNDSIGHWTDLGVLAGDCILVMKALQLLVKDRQAQKSASEDKPKSSITEMPAGLPDVELKLSKFEFKLTDDSFEIWMGAFQRLHLDEAKERLKREEMLKKRIQILRGSGCEHPLSPLERAPTSHKHT